MKKTGRSRSSPPSPPAPGARVVRVVPAVTAIDKEFDYLVPPDLAAAARVGTEVRVDLHGRRVGGWIVAMDVEPPEELDLRYVAKLRGYGPEPATVELAGWAAWRWAGRRSSLLSTASADHAVPSLAAPRLGRPADPGVRLPELDVVRPAVLRQPPSYDPTPLVAALAQYGPTLVVVPSAGRAGILAQRLRRAGGDVALVPGEWNQARAGAAVVVGARAAAWAPCPGLAAAMVIDGHDESLGQEQAPTWNAVEVVAERARRAGVPCLVTSACPTPELLSLGELQTPERTAERRGWATVEVLDRRGDDPRLGLYSERLVSVIRGTRRVACILNRTGRARLLACAACGELARCESCGAALVQRGGLELECPSCGMVRPSVCASCGSMVMRFLRVGVTRAREELELLAGRAVAEVNAATVGMPPTEVLVGTEALLHRISPSDGFEVVAFVDFDQELLAPRMRAGSEALGLLATASRLVGGRAGRILVQTRMPEHPAIRAALLADPQILSDWELEVRRPLRLPPHAAVAVVSGDADPAGQYVAGLAGLACGGVEVLGPRLGEWLLKAPDYRTLADALAAVPRPSGRIRVAVNPARM